MLSGYTCFIQHPDGPYEPCARREDVTGHKAIFAIEDGPSELPLGPDPVEWTWEIQNFEDNHLKGKDIAVIELSASVFDYIFPTAKGTII